MSPWTTAPAIVTLLTAATLTPVASAQLPYGRLDSIFPPGGQIGTQFDASIGGTDVDMANQILFSHPGITAVAKQTAGTEFESSHRIPNHFEIRIAEGVPPGIYEAIAVGPWGQSTPRAFQVGTETERREPTDNQSFEKAAPLAINEVLNGRVSPNSADFYRLTLEEGKRVLIQLDANAIDSQMDGTLVLYDSYGTELTRSRDHRGRDPLIDFVAPASGDYVVKVYDFTFRGGDGYYYRLTPSDRPLIEFAIPPAIQPGKTMSVAFYGRNLPASTPHAAWQVSGRSLERITRSVTAPVMSPRHAEQTPFGAKPNSVEVKGFYRSILGRPFFFAFASAPSVNENNLETDDEHSTSVGHGDRLDAPDNPQRVSPPCEIVGQFYPARDDDWYEFQASQGDVYWIEVICQRQGLPADPYLLIQRVETKDDGSETVTDVAEVDDHQERPGGLAYQAAPADPVYKLTVPADGTYRVLVRDLAGQSRSRPQNVYRLAIRPANPDFHLMVTPNSPFDPDPAQPVRWSSVLRQGGSIVLPVSVIRADGFADQIDVTVAGLPEGTTAPTTTIGPGQNSGILVISADDSVGGWSGPIEIVGTAVRQGRPVMRRADFATLTWDTPGKNKKRSTRLTRFAILSLSKEPAPLQVRMAGSDEIAICRGGKISIPFSLHRNGEVKGKPALTATAIPPGIHAEVKLEDGEERGLLHLTVEPAAKPGRYSFCLTGTTQVSYRRLPDRVDLAETERKGIETVTAQLLAAKTAATEALASIDSQINANNEELLAATQRLTTLTQKTNTPVEELDAAKQAVETKKAEIEAASPPRNAAAIEAAASEQKYVAANEALTRLTERVKKLTEDAKPTDRSFYAVSNPVALQVAPDAVRITCPSSVTVIQGTTQAITINVERLFDFAGNVRIEPAIGENVKLTSAPIDVAADSSTANINLTAAPDAAVGKHVLTLTTKFDFNGFSLDLVTKTNVVITSPPAATTSTETAAGTESPTPADGENDTSDGTP